MLTFFIITVVHLMIFVMIIIIRKKDKVHALKSKRFVNTFGAMTEGLSLKGFAGKYWNLIALIRWSVVSVILVALRDYST